MQKFHKGVPKKQRFLILSEHFDGGLSISDSRKGINSRLKLWIGVFGVGNVKCKCIFFIFWYSLQIID